MNPTVVSFIYLVAGILFILGIKGLTKPKTAVRGNKLSALGMLIAVVVTLLDGDVVNYNFIIAGVLVGSGIGAVMALKIQMTSMPQMVALLNGFGGGASLTIALAEYYSKLGSAPESFSEILTPVVTTSSNFGSGPEGTIALVSIGLTVLIGALTLTGSLVAFAKLQELMKKSYGLPGGPIGNGIFLVASAVAVVCLVLNPGNTAAMVAIVGLALLLGLFLVMPIGGADMPVVIALLNSYSGIAAALAGFILGNTVLIVAGSLVGT
ncbi:MAG: NAD synthetase, partial [Porticoccaceae bacterium]|nr:NAD synthetase [Porticoccaceae bacterium]